MRRLADLGEAERAAVLDKVHRLHGELVGLAESMEAPQRSGAERNFARLLRHALTAPGEETLYVVDGKPVMTFWGFSADAALPGVFLASRAAVPPPAARCRRDAASGDGLGAGRACAAPVTRSAWWQWLLLALLLLLLLAGLAWLLRPYLPHLEPRLEAEARDRALAFSVRQPVELQQVRFTTLQQDNENLRLELARLTDELSRARAAIARPASSCPGGVSWAPTARRSSAAPAPDDKARRRQRRRQGRGRDRARTRQGPNDDKNVDKGPTTRAPTGSDKTRAPTDKTRTNGQTRHGRQDKAKKDEPKPMVVPPEAKQKQDLAFMKGDWRSRTGLATATGEKDIRPSYTLDDKGKGKVSFVQQNGTTCEAPAEARWDGGKLVIEEKANPKCADGRTYARNTVNCEVDKDGVAQCKGSQPGDKRSYNVQIGR